MKTLINLQEKQINFLTNIRELTDNDEINKLVNKAIENCEKTINLINYIDYSKTKIRCFECKTHFNYTEKDIIDDAFVICPECGNKICILS